MKVFISNPHTNDIQNYNDTIIVARQLNGDFNDEVIFHCYWNGKITEKQLISLYSCYHFNVKNRNNRKLILWVENVDENIYFTEIKKYAEIRIFNMNEEIRNTFLENKIMWYTNNVTFYSDVVRCVLLYKYAGMWFDLDTFFFRSFDPIFYNFGNEIIVYSWERQNYPNNAIFISLKKNDERLKKLMEFFISQNRSWGFQQSNLHYGLDIEMIVLPCCWFDAGWIENEMNFGCNDFFLKEDEYDINNFFNGIFCFHWHGRFDLEIKEKSPIRTFYNLIKNA